MTVSSLHRAWLSQSLATTANNIANSNTPDFKARQVSRFADVLSSVPADSAVRTHPAHLMTIAHPPRGMPSDEVATEGSTHSGNTVDLDRELMRASEIKGGFTLNTTLSKAFYRMLHISIKG